MHEKNITRNVPIHFIGLGGAGSNIVEFIYKKGIKAEYTMITDPKRQNLATEITFIEFNPEARSLRKDNIDNRFSNSFENISIPIDVNTAFSKNEHYVLISGFGGFTGTLLTQKMAMILSENNKSFCIVCTAPFDFEGTKRKLFANEAKKELQNISNFNCFDLQLIREKYGNIFLSEAFERADEELFKIIETMVFLEK